MRLWLGALFGLAAGAGGYHLYQHVLPQRTDACLDRCGEGTRCRESRCVADIPPPLRASGRRASHRATRKAVDGDGGRLPSAAELEVRSEGANLQGIDYVNPADKDGDERELSTAEVDAKVRTLDAQVVNCIDRARGSIDFRTGQVVLAFRIERSGHVEKVRVSAPAGLQRAGLYACLRSLVTALSFPRSSQALVMRYPYGLR